MDRARPIRIARRPVAAAAPATPPPAAPAPPAEPPGEYRENRGGTRRASRLFVLVLAAVVALYVGLLGLLARGPGGIGTNDPLLAFLGVFAVALGVLGWQVTLGQTPRGVWREGSRLLVRERLGRRRELAGDPPGSPIVARRYAASWLNPEATILVRVKDVTGLSRLYLVGTELLPGTDR